MRLLQFIFAVLFLAALTQCRNTTSNSATSESVSIEVPSSKLNMCAAIRGNGHYILSHFGAMARVTEVFGVMDALAGGSSASITMFLYESMLMNPLLTEATPEERQTRLALLLKSALGYYEVVKSSDEIQSFRLLYDVVSKAQQQGHLNLDSADVAKSAFALRAIFSDPLIVSLVNPKVLDTLSNREQLSPEQWSTKVRSIQKSALSLLKFEAKSQDIFFREGVISFDGLAAAMDRVANFYAGRKPVELNAMERFLNECSKGTTGQDWTKIKLKKVAGSNCQTMFDDLLKNYRSQVAQGIAATDHRFNETIGSRLPTIVSTSIIADPDAVTRFKQAERRFEQNESPDFDIHFDSVRFGYWAPAPQAQAISRSLSGVDFIDQKQSKFYHLGANSSWRDALKASPAEPGLSRGVHINDNVISLGGWSDLAPVQVLKDSGCDHVVYVTRLGAESSFITAHNPIETDTKPDGVAELLRMDDKVRRAIYDLSNQNSSFSRALKLADYVWCTDWNRFKDFEVAPMYSQSYNAELIINTPTPVATALTYPFRSNRKIEGCTPPSDNP